MSANYSLFRLFFFLIDQSIMRDSLIFNLTIWNTLKKFQTENLKFRSKTNYIFECSSWLYRQNTIKVKWFLSMARINAIFPQNNNECSWFEYTELFSRSWYKKNVFKMLIYEISVYKRIHLVRKSDFFKNLSMKGRSLVLRGYFKIYAFANKYYKIT